MDGIGSQLGLCHLITLCSLVFEGAISWKLHIGVTLC